MRIYHVRDDGRFEHRRNDITSCKDRTDRTIEGEIDNQVDRYSDEDDRYDDVVVTDENDDVD